MDETSPPLSEDKEKLAKTFKGQALGGDKRIKAAIKKVPHKKRYLKVPFKRDEWPLVTDELCQKVVDVLKQLFKAEGLERKLCARGGKKMQERKLTDPVCKDAENQPSKWKSLIFGINAVTRALEKEQASLVLCDRNVYPSQLTAHLVELSIHNRIPGANILHLASIGSHVGLRSITCMAFKLLDDIESVAVREAVSSIVDMVPQVKKTTQQQPDPAVSMSVSDVSCTSGTSDETVSSITNDFPLPPDNIDFASLYVFKKDLKFSRQEDFISLSSSMKRQSDAVDQFPATKKLRYISAELGNVKRDPDRHKVKKSSKES